MKKTTVKKLSTSLTIQEFKMWLDGLCAFNTPEWTPNLQQWHAIRDRIMNLRENKPVAPPIPPQQFIPPRQMITPNTGTFITPDFEPFNDGNITEEEIAQKMAEAKRLGASNVIKAKHIDSSNGYKSEFT